ncbi:HK97 gp10 family phage protein [Candidatus Enterococcus clewellii]|uniref:HK97 gp10 family phage protein n=1 Tax=Candidatus Enterococcus clewellii TaxID=1834193 RepID=UPI000A35460D
MDWISALNAERDALYDKVHDSLEVQLENAITISPVDTGELKRSWKLNRNSKNSWTVKNTCDHAIFQEFGTYKQAGREMWGLRSGRWTVEVIGRIR